MAGVDGPPPAGDVCAVLENQRVGLRGRAGFACRRRGGRRRQGNTELDGLSLMDINCLRLIPDLDVKLLGVAGLHQPRDLAAILQSDDIGEEPTAGQQAELPKDEQEDSSHIHLLNDVSENDPEIELESQTDLRPGFRLRYTPLPPRSTGAGARGCYIAPITSPPCGLIVSFRQRRVQPGTLGSRHAVNPALT